MFVVCKQPPRTKGQINCRFPVSFCTHTSFFYAHAQWEHIALSACSVVYNITPLLSNFGKSKDIFALTLTLHKKEHDNSMCQQYALRILHTAYAERYCNATKEGGREWYPSNRYDIAYKRPCFLHLKSYSRALNRKKPLLCFRRNRNAKK
jgi:hypothetical protein